jgi:hypothetical protein
MAETACELLPPRRESIVRARPGGESLRGQLAAHLGGVLVGVQIGQQVQGLAPIQLDDGGDPLGLESRLPDLCPVADDQAQAGLGAGIDANDFGLAAERGDIGIGLSSGIGIPQGRPETIGRRIPSPTTSTPAAPNALSLSALVLVTSLSFMRKRVMQASRLAPTFTRGRNPWSLRVTVSIPTCIRTSMPSGM